jgi:hypothetical protein
MIPTTRITTRDMVQPTPQDGRGDCRRCDLSQLAEAFRALGRLKFWTIPFEGVILSTPFTHYQKKLLVEKTTMNVGEFSWFLSRQGVAAVEKKGKTT